MKRQAGSYGVSMILPFPNHHLEGQKSLSGSEDTREHSIREGKRRKENYYTLLCQVPRHSSNPQSEGLHTD